jgi:glycosyltransferase involved in cell wall biosynthesis
MLQKAFETEIVGPVLGKGVWTPLSEDNSVPYRCVNVEKGLKSGTQLAELYKKLDGDLVYACKPLLQSFGLGILKKILDDVPLILDIDDWEWGLKKVQYSDLDVNRGLFLAKTFLGPDALITYTNGLLQGCLTHYADGITVSNTFLKSKFGGEVIYHAADTSFFDPERFDCELIRAKHAIKESTKVVMFAGTPGPNKGLDDLVESVSQIKDINIKLFVVGTDSSEYCVRLIHKANKMLRQRFVGLPTHAFRQLPEYLSIADLVVIPQRRSAASVGQIPAKTFTAMAMAKPVIATNVNDLPQILGDCGWIVEPDNPSQLALTIENAFKRPEEAQEKGKKAREKCIKSYSTDAIGKTLVAMVTEYV